MIEGIQTFLQEAGESACYALAALLFSSVVGVLRSEELYLVSENDLTRYEQLQAKSRTDKQNWLLLVRKSQRESAGLKTEISGLKQLSVNLNDQLSNQRKQTKKWEKSYNEYVTENLTRLSQKDTEIAEKDRIIAGQKLTLEKTQNQRNMAWAVIGMFAAATVIGIYQKIKGKPMGWRM